MVTPTIRYTWRDDGGYRRECEGCDAKAPLSEFSNLGATRLLCEFCANTTGWDQMYDPTAAIVIKAQNAGFNVLLQALTRAIDVRG